MLLAVFLLYEQVGLHLSGGQVCSGQKKKTNKQLEEAKPGMLSVMSSLH